MIRLEDSEERKNIQNFFTVEEGCSPELEKVGGIELVEKRNWKEDYVNDFDCAVYVFGSRSKAVDHYETDMNEIIMTTKGYEETNRPLPGDLVVYIDTIKEKEQAHIGIYQPGKKVLSKWVYGNVYLHDVDKVPLSFGDTVKFFRREFPGGQ